MTQIDDPASDVTAAELIGRAHELRELLQRNAPQADDDRRVPDESIEALRAKQIV